MLFSLTKLQSSGQPKNGFNFHCYTQHEAMPTQKSALARKITKGIHSCKPASPNRMLFSHKTFHYSDKCLTALFTWTELTI